MHEEYCRGVVEAVAEPFNSLFEMPVGEEDVRWQVEPPPILSILYLRCEEYSDDNTQ